MATRNAKAKNAPSAIFPKRCCFFSASAQGVGSTNWLLFHSRSIAEGGICCRDVMTDGKVGCISEASRCSSDREGSAA